MVFKNAIVYVIISRQPRVKVSTSLLKDGGVAVLRFVSVFNFRQ